MPLSPYSDEVDLNDLDLNEEDMDAYLAMNYTDDGEEEFTTLGQEDPVDVGGEEMLDQTKIKFPPSLEKWKDIPFSSRPKVTIDHARGEMWNQGKTEIEYILKHIQELEPTEDGRDGDLEKLLDLLFGDDSELFHAFKKILPKRGYKSSGNKMDQWEVYCRFLSTFFFICINNRTYRKLHEYVRSDTTDLLEPDVFDEILRNMESYNKGHPNKPRFWKVLENAFNEMARENFLLGPKDGSLKLGTDDDKVHANVQNMKDIPIDQESGLKRVRHVNDNVNGINNHVVSYAATGLPIQMAFEQTGQKIYDVFVGLMRGMFCKENSQEFPDLSNYVQLFVDRGYLKLPLLLWWLHTGGNILATVMRQDW